MAPSEEVTNVDGRTLEGILQPERVDDEHGVVEEKFRREPPKPGNRFWFICGPKFRCKYKCNSTKSRTECTRCPLVLPCKDLSLHGRDDEKIVGVGLKPRWGACTGVQKIQASGEYPLQVLLWPVSGVGLRKHANDVPHSQRGRHLNQWRWVLCTTEKRCG